MEMHKKLKKKKKYFKRLGFKVDGFEDGSDHWFVKKIKNSFLLGYAEVSVSYFNGNLYMIIECYNKEDIEGGFFTVYEGKFKKKRLKKILKLLK
jgi:hypothetical protein